MAKKTSPVDKNIKQDLSKAKGGKEEKAGVKTGLRKQTNGKQKTASRPASMKPVQKRNPQKPLSLKRQLAQREAELQIINSIQQGLAAEPLKIAAFGDVADMRKRRRMRLGQLQQR